jgi:nuclear pore complex protein Nup160
VAGIWANVYRKGEFLGQLISVMCENNEVGRLNALGFIGFQQKVEELLSFKARNSDPLRYPNYYKVLYSWHISRGDYRSGTCLSHCSAHVAEVVAGEIMYKQGRRFAAGSSSKVTAFDLAAMQARSYLAAINALSLVDKRNAWIAIPASMRPTRVCPSAYVF